MGGSLMAEGYWLMLNEVGLSQIGDLVDLVVDLELPGLEVKKLTKSILGERFSNQEDPLGLRSQGHEKIGILNGTGKFLVKGEGTRKEIGRSHVSAPMISHGIVTTEKIGIIEIVKERETETRRENEAVIVTVIGHVIEVGTVAVTMSVIERETVVVIVITLGTGRGIMKSVTMTVGVPMIGMSQNMRGIGLVKGTMIMLSQRMIVAGMNNLSRGKGCQMQKMSRVMITMSIIEAGGSTITWMSKVTMTAMINIQTVIMIVMIKWRAMITNMIVEHLSHVKRSVNIEDQRGHFPGIMTTENVVLLRVCHAISGEVSTRSLETFLSHKLHSIFGFDCMNACLFNFLNSFSLCYLVSLMDLQYFVLAPGQK
ncbi:hypothetical protein OIU79_000278 [Salix purpurea]|uniref:Uncharacterized protein n=1 Tax=Salix purpurea TaxID=77065 RepID=A0A9Q0V1P4_SALPP|nr:hypothetical protein OIU79_000278 [Salix purpurea]